jgi:Ni/Co efflux regulator RcnB
MLKPNRISIVLAAAALIIVPTLLTAPASAETNVYSVAQNNQDRDRDGRRDYRQDGNGDRGNLNRDRDGRRNYRQDGNGDRSNWNRNDRSYPGEARNSRDRDNWNRDNQSYSRVVRLGNGDIRYPNGQIIPARSIARLRNQGYFRLPNGDILLPSQEIVPAGRLVRVRDDYFRLPSGLVLQINL